MDMLELGEGTGAVKFRPPLGPVGALNPAGPRGGDLATARGGERSRAAGLTGSRGSLDSRGSRSLKLN